eukprot:244261-Pelagomonas_calceolata.AAC.1
MGIVRVVSRAPRRPDSPFPDIHIRAPSNPLPPPKPPVSKRACLVLLIVVELCRAWQLNLKARGCQAESVTHTDKCLKCSIL